MSQNPKHSPEEIYLLELLRDVQATLATSINSLGPDSVMKPEMRFVAWSAVTVNRAADGYLLLRTAFRVDSSKLLVRPIIEAVFAATAVSKKRGFLFRKVYTEILEERKFHGNCPEVEVDLERVLKELELVSKRDDPHYPAVHKKVDVKYTAQAAEMVEAYNVIYRTYCQFTHGAISAVSGQLNEITNNLDTQIVIRYVIMILELLKKCTPAKVPDLATFPNRLPQPESGKTTPP